MPEQPIGELLDALGVTDEPREGELILDAVVLLKVVDAEGNVNLRTRYTETSSWIERVGMYRVAAQGDLDDVRDLDA